MVQEYELSECLEYKFYIQPVAGVGGRCGVVGASSTGQKVIPPECDERIELREASPRPLCRGMHLLVGSNRFNLANSGCCGLYRKSQASDAYQPSYYTQPIEARKLPPFVGLSNSAEQFWLLPGTYLTGLKVLRFFLRRQV